MPRNLSILVLLLECKPIGIGVALCFGQQTIEGDIYEDAHCNDVQESSGPKNPAESDSLQALRRPDLFAEFSQSPPRIA
jgi:hypothetical protein